MSFTKTTKRLLAVFAALVMALAVAVPAFATDGNNTGSITITNATAGESYTIYKIFDTDSSGTGNITATEAQKTFYESQYGNPFSFTANAAGTYNVTIKEGFVDADVIAFLQSFVTASTDGEVTVNSNFASVTTKYDSLTAGESTTLVFSSIPYGYYLVTSSLGAVVTVDSTDPNIKVIDKNQDGGSSFIKQVDTDNEVVEIGEEFEYTLKFTATNYDGETQIAEYIITDVLGTGLELVCEENDSSYGVSVMVGEQSVTPTVTYDEEKSTLTITISWVDESGNSRYGSPIEVKVTYTAVLTESASIQTDITNSATLTWTGNVSGTSTAETVQTYALAIMKVDEKGGALEGATFTVTKNDTDVNVKYVGIDNTTQAAIYVVDPDSESNVVVSPTSGLIVIKGVDENAYTLTETAAPSGYNLLNSSLTVTPSKTGSTTITIYYDANGNVINTATDSSTSTSVTAPVSVTATVVVNSAGTELPSTGGMGTTVLYAVGAALVIGAGVTLVVRRRMGSNA